MKIIYLLLLTCKISFGMNEISSEQDDEINRKGSFFEYLEYFNINFNTLNYEYIKDTTYLYNFIFFIYDYCFGNLHIEKESLIDDHDPIIKISQNIIEINKITIHNMENFNKIIIYLIENFIDKKERNYNNPLYVALINASKTFAVVFNEDIQKEFKKENLFFKNNIINDNNTRKCMPCYHFHRDSVQRKETIKGKFNLIERIKNCNLKKENIKTINTNGPLPKKIFQADIITEISFENNNGFIRTIKVENDDIDGYFNTVHNNEASGVNPNKKNFYYIFDIVFIVLLVILVGYFLSKPNNNESEQKDTNKIDTENKNIIDIK